MKMEKNYLDQIEEFSEFELPDVNLSDEEIERVRVNIMSVLANLEEKNREMKFNLTQEELMELKENLGSDSEKMVNGVKQSLLMRDIMIKNIEKQLEGEVIVKKVVFEAPSIIYWGLSAVNNICYLTEKEFIYYGFDINYKEVSSFRCLIKDIKEAGRTIDKEKEDKNMLEFIVKTPDKWIAMYTVVKSKSTELDELMELLIEKGVKQFDKKKLERQNKIVYIIIAILTVGGILASLRPLFKTF